MYDPSFLSCCMFSLAKLAEYLAVVLKDFRLEVPNQNLVELIFLNAEADAYDAALDSVTRIFRVSCSSFCSLYSK